LKGVPGVTPTSVDIGAAKLTYDPEQATPEQIVDAVTEEGYQVTVR
ncbi:MAG: heavy-metal-associated domain-containing protein, partial [Clostridiales bacterium]|nr:heavy-metal-associated domain-containing protein [Clostridiales bacterium]